MVEYSAHNGTYIGSIPIKPRLFMKFLKYFYKNTNFIVIAMFIVFWSFFIKRSNGDEIIFSNSNHRGVYTIYII